MTNNHRQSPLVSKTEWAEVPQLEGLQQVRNVPVKLVFQDQLRFSTRMHLVRVEATRVITESPTRDCLQHLRPTIRLEKLLKRDCHLHALRLAHHPNPKQGSSNSSSSISSSSSLYNHPVSKLHHVIYMRRLSSLKALSQLHHPYLQKTPIILTKLLQLCQNWQKIPWLTNHQIWYKPQKQPPIRDLRWWAKTPTTKECQKEGQFVLRWQLD